jgi:Tol biopolymer transport system component
MTKRHLFLTGILPVLFFTAHVTAQKADTASVPKDTKWIVSDPHGPQTQVSFETNEGTWMSLDVSPDGQSIAFDLLGDIYSVPISGGEAKLLLGGIPYETQPQYSHDGKRIAFTSDRDGSENIWTMNPDGTDLKQVTKEKERQTSNPVWTPDGQYVIARKHYRNTRSLGAGEMWMYHITGGGGVQLTKRRNWQQNSSDPELSPDGRYLYYDEDMSPGDRYEYNRDPYGVIYVIRRLDRVTGKLTTFAGGNGGSVRPVASPDGNFLAFIRRVRLQSVLFIRDLRTDEEWPLYDGLSKDAQETWAIFGLYPAFAWTPDAKSIVIWAKGKILKVDVASGEATEIPFKVNVQQSITNALRYNQQVAPDSFDVKMLRWVSTSPDGKQVVYSALGQLWTKELPDDVPHRLTDDDHFEFYPSFSHDGKWIVYAAWDDQEKGSLCKVKSSGGSGTKVTLLPGTYTEPSFSQDDKKIVFVKNSGDLLRGQAHGSNPGIYWVPSEGGEPVLITEDGGSPRFSKDNARIFLSAREGEKAALISVNLSGGDRRVHLTSDNAQQIVPSPDEQWVFFTERFNSYIATLPLSGQPVHVSPGSSDFPVKRVTRDAGMYLHWSPDSKTVYWSLGPELFSRKLTDTFVFVDGAPDSVSDKPDTSGIMIGFRAATDKPGGSIALVGATVISMNGDEVIQDATILIDENRISAVGPSGQISPPRGATVIDVRGKTIMPGMIDVHAHGPAGSLGITPQQNWAFHANLAFGVTTEHDPSNDTEEVFASSELIKGGLTVGPRLYSTGTILYGGEGSFKAVIDNLKTQGRTSGD